MMFEHPDFDRHEHVAFCHDPSSGLRAIIALHTTSLGPAIGGCRMLPYASSAAALTDVLRLAQGMTYKCAIGGIPYGGGKAVIMGDPRRDKTPELLAAMARFVDSLSGRYITSFDSGTTLEDLKIMRTHTPHIGELAAGHAANSTAYGVFVCIRTAVQQSLLRPDLTGVTVAIQGVGSVGARLVGLLADAGAQLMIADTSAEAVAAVAAQTGARSVPPDEIHLVPADVFAPCALGGAINDTTLPQLRAKIVAGAANNQLAAAHHAAALQRRGIVYCPDFLVNAGGIIDVHYQHAKLDAEALTRHLDSLGDTLAKILEQAAREGQTTAFIANRIAEERFQKRASG